MNFSTHTWAVERLAANSIAAPRDWSQLLYRFREYESLSRPCLNTLASEIVSPTGQDIAMLRAAALAEEAALAGRDLSAPVGEFLRHVVGDQLVKLYRPVAQRNYDECAKRYDGVARQFTTAAEEARRSLGVRGRDFWLDEPEHAESLDRARELLGVAALLAGTPTDPNTVELLPAETELALCADARKAPRRKVWAAWEAENRWGALLKLDGVELRAAAKPADLRPYSRPQPMVPVAVKGGRTEWRDPENGPVREPVRTGWSQ